MKQLMKCQPAPPTGKNCSSGSNLDLQAVLATDTVFIVVVFLCVFEVLDFLCPSSWAATKKGDAFGNNTLNLIKVGNAMRGKSEHQGWKKVYQCNGWYEAYKKQTELG